MNEPLRLKSWGDLIAAKECATVVFEGRIYQDVSFVLGLIANNKKIKTQNLAITLN